MAYRKRILTVVAASAFSFAGTTHAADLEAGAGFSVGVSLDPSNKKVVPLPTGVSPEFSVDASAVKITFSYASIVPNPTTLSNITIYVTLESRAKHTDDKQGDQGTVLATFGCAVGNWPSNSANLLVIGSACNNAPLSWSNNPEAANHYPIVIDEDLLNPPNKTNNEIVAVVNVNYIADGQLFRTGRKIIDVSLTPSPAGLTAIPGRRFEAGAAYVDGGLKFDSTKGTATIDPNGIAVYLRSAGAVSDVEVLADFSWGKDAADANQAGHDFGIVGCAVGPLEAGQATAYQGVSCNLPQALTIINPEPGGQLFAKFSVSYPQANVGWSQPEPVPHLTTDGTVPARLVFTEDKNCADQPTVKP